MRRDTRLAGIAARLFSILCLSIMLALVKLLAMRGVTLFESVFYRQALALPLVLGWIVAGPGLASVRTSRIGAHAWRTGLGMVGMVLNFATFILLPLAEATTILFSVPIFATILSALVLREPTGIHRWLAVVVGFAGVVIVAQPAGTHLSPLGIGVGLLASIAIAGVSITLRQIGRTEDATTTVFWFTILSTVPLAFALPFAGHAHDAVTWAMLLALGLTGGLAQFALTTSLKLAPVSVVLPMDYSNLLWSTLLGFLLFDTLPTMAMWLGAPLIIASGLYIVYRERIRRQENTAAAGADA
ncbi:DMT family transporter [Sphingomonas flavalba]|uniref:DMT family transporter n=1 Tax=Sphingomonas flavalba TaxID=2559804 RepID=UPI0039E17367